MSNIEPNMQLELGDGFVRATMEYGPDALNEMARRVGDKLDEQLLARLGYVKPVRCRDCESAADHCEGMDIYWCEYLSRYVGAGMFCAWGVRKGVTE